MEATVLKRAKIVWIVFVIAAVVAIGTMVGTAVAQQQTSNAKQSDKSGLGDAEVKKLILLMDTDKNGKISKKEYMDFMSAEFDRLDTDHSGELDPKELKQSKLRVSPFPSVGK
jgi:hypothetical protein